MTTNNLNPQSEIRNPKSNDTGRRNAGGPRPRWQQISGITPANEAQLSEDERDAGIRKLIAEVERLAKDEFSRGEKTPHGERTVLWDPLEKVCRRLEISRTKLSAFSRELTGMRAHEIADRIKAKDLLKKLYEHAVELLMPDLEALKHSKRPQGVSERQYAVQLTQKLWKIVKDARAGAAKVRWAAELGFANPSRLSRACLLAHGTSIDEMEWRAISLLVQKFLETLPKQPVLSPAEQAAQMKAATQREVEKYVQMREAQRREMAQIEEELLEKCAG